MRTLSFKGSSKETHLIFLGENRGFSEVTHLQSRRKWSEMKNNSQHQQDGLNRSDNPTKSPKTCSASGFCKKTSIWKSIPEFFLEGFKGDIQHPLLDVGIGNISQFP